MDALIGDPEILNPRPDGKLKAKTLAIPEDFIRRTAEIRAELSTRGEACIEILKSFNHILSDIHRDGKHATSNGMEIKFIHDYGYKPNYYHDSSKEAVLMAAKKYQKDNPNESLAILTGDDAMSSMALNADIDVAHINPNIYTGRREVILPVELYTTWEKHGAIPVSQFAKYFPDEEPLRMNEFVEFTATEDVPFGNKNFYDYIGRVEQDKYDEEPTLRRLHYISNLPKWIAPKNAGQAMFLEALFAPAWEIPIVVCEGIYGTGKTFLATVAAYHQTVTMKHYDRIFVVPSEGSIGQDIGALPGEKDEKIGPQAAPIMDNLYNMFKLMKNKKKGDQPSTSRDWRIEAEKCFENNIELEALAFIGGRTISDSIIIYDEFQALERYQAKQLLTRVGDGSKMVCTGDRHQVYNPHMNASSNGLAYAASKLCGSRRAAVITIMPHEIVRSEAAMEIARLMG